MAEKGMITSSSENGESLSCPKPFRYHDVGLKNSHIVLDFANGVIAKNVSGVNTIAEVLEALSLVTDAIHEMECPLFEDSRMWNNFFNSVGKVKSSKELARSKVSRVFEEYKCQWLMKNKWEQSNSILKDSKETDSIPGDFDVDSEQSISDSYECSDSDESCDEINLIQREFEDESYSDYSVVPDEETNSISGELDEDDDKPYEDANLISGEFDEDDKPYEDADSLLGEFDEDDDEPDEDDNLLPGEFHGDGYELDEDDNLLPGEFHGDGYELDEEANLIIDEKPAEEEPADEGKSDSNESDGVILGDEENESDEDTDLIVKELTKDEKDILLPVLPDFINVPRTGHEQLLKAGRYLIKTTGDKEFPHVYEIYTRVDEMKLEQNTDPSCKTIEEHSHTVVKNMPEIEDIDLPKERMTPKVEERNLDSDYCDHEKIDLSSSDSVIAEENICSQPKPVISEIEKEVDIFREVLHNTSTIPDYPSRVQSLQSKLREGSKEFEKDTTRSVTKEFEEKSQLLLNIVLQNTMEKYCNGKETDPDPVVAADEADPDPVVAADEADSDSESPVGVKDMKSWLDNPDVEKIARDYRDAKHNASLVKDSHYESRNGDYKRVLRAYKKVWRIECAIESLRSHNNPNWVPFSAVEEFDEGIWEQELMDKMKKSGIGDEEIYPVPEEREVPVLEDIDSIEMNNEETSIPEDTAEEKELICWWDTGPDKTRIERDARRAMREAMLIIHRFESGEGDVNEIVYAYRQLRNIESRMEFAIMYDVMNDTLRSAPKISTETPPTSEKVVSPTVTTEREERRHSLTDVIENLGNEDQEADPVSVDPEEANRIPDEKDLICWWDFGPDKTRSQ